MESDSGQDHGSVHGSNSKDSPGDTSRAAALLKERKGVFRGRRRLAALLATGFGLGYSPVAPGTLGAALGVGLYCALLPVGALQITLPLISMGLFFLGVYLSSAAEEYFQEKDCQKIVVDELASFPLTMLFLSPTPVRIAIAFALNRVVDILKPFPAGRMQRLKGGWGVMLDDAVAAMYANLLLRVIILALKI